MKIPIILVIACVLFSLNVVANPEQEERLFELEYPKEKQAAEQTIPNIVERYALSFGCMFDMQKQNVVELKDWEQLSYVSLYSLDLGCSGGSAMSRSYFVVISNYDRSHPRNIFVNPKYSLPSQTSEKFPSHLESIYLENGKLKYRAREYNWATDSLASPSIIVIGEVEFKNNIWQPKSQEK